MDVINQFKEYIYQNDTKSAKSIYYSLQLYDIVDICYNFAINDQDDYCILAYKIMKRNMTFITTTINQMILDKLHESGNLNVLLKHQYLLSNEFYDIHRLNCSYDVFSFCIFHNEHFDMKIIFLHIIRTVQFNTLDMCIDLFRLCAKERIQFDVNIYDIYVYNNFCVNDVNNVKILFSILFENKVKITPIFIRKVFEKRDIMMMELFVIYNINPIEIINGYHSTCESDKLSELMQQMNINIYDYINILYLDVKN
jgi:hypothetical protein